MLIMFLVAASNFFSTEFSALGLPKMMAEALLWLDLAPFVILILVMALIFLLLWPLEWVPIVLLVVPILLSKVIALDLEYFDSTYDMLLWFGIFVAVNLQTAWVSPPVDLSTYFPKGVVPSWDLKDIYLGMMQWSSNTSALPYCLSFPKLILWLPKHLSG